MSSSGIFNPKRLALSYLCAFSLHAAAGPELCDPTLRQSHDSAYAYQQRNDRCEGIYVREVSSTALIIASLTDTLQNYDLNSNTDLEVSWESPTNADVRVRAQGLRRRLYYRMDTVWKSTKLPFRWPIALLAALNIPNTELGVTGWTSMRLGDREREVFLPVHVIQRGAPRTANNTYLLTLLPGVDLKEVYISLAIVDSNGSPTNYLRSDEPLKYGYYPAERRVDIPLVLNAPGFYLVEIGAKLTNEGSTTVDFLVYHALR